MADQIDFAAALPALVAGKSITRAAWDGKRNWTLTAERPDSDRMVVETEGDKKTGLGLLQVNDLLATDWAVLPDQVEG